MAGVDAAGWEDAIDVDDSDLPSLLSPPPPPLPNPSLPSLRPCSQPPRPSSHAQPPDTAVPPEKVNSDARRLIPGPAGAVQAAMLRRSASPAVLPLRTGPRLETEVGADFRPDLGEEDEDFKMNPWLCALNFLENGHGSLISIGSIKNCGSDFERVPQVSGIVKSCTPNGLGDLFITLKDPTGVIGASVHRGVIVDGNLGGDISVGCVLILKQVVVFRPVRSACYLNVTLNNVVKLISKDCGLPPKQVLPTFTERYGASNNHMETGLAVPEIASSMRQGPETVFPDQIGRNSICEPIIGNRMAEGVAMRLSNIVRSSAAAGNMAAVPDNIASEPENLMSNASNAQRSNAQESAAITNIAAAVPDHRASEPKKQRCTESTAQWNNVQGAQRNTNKEGGITSNLEKLLHGRKTQAVASSFPHTVSATIPISNITLQPDTAASEPNKLISGRSIAQWTDEQLAELFADNQDDPGLW
ncbi:hypothetical protein J5N97_020044 [Dioscorea zingiberensis]|uniref:Homologous recombination OB-fold protein OB-fold domain-containing protein n=1 Tax=Dioscorea zingiberensis TaxID=325984 RepID=A0A9D5CH72_9LILI|nr:hypothetical protein J5N97_020044 [Dioscorea zingiberensis]